MNNIEITHLLHLSHCMMHGIQAIFPPSEINQHGGSESVSENNLDKGYGTWAYRNKYSDGFSMTNITHCTFQVEKQRISYNGSTTSKTHNKKTDKILENLAGNIQHSSFGIPGVSGIFSPIHVALEGTHQWLQIISNLTQCLRNWGEIIKHMGKHPTHVRQLDNKFSKYVGYSDSCGIVIRGIWTSGLNTIGPIIWQI